MPDRDTIERAKKDKQEGKSPSTQAGEFVRQEMDHIREGKHGARNTKQAIAIGLSEARRAGVDIPPPKKGTTSERTRRQAERESAAAGGTKKPSKRRSQATIKALEREGRSAASHASLASHARSSARKRTAAQRSASAKKAARTRARERH
jgi:hypothetical protein